MRERLWQPYPRLLTSMNGTDAWGVHGLMETIVTSDVVGQPVPVGARLDSTVG